MSDLRGEIVAEIGGLLDSLDTSNDDHWTADGAPRVGAVRDLAGASLAEYVTRESIADARPGLTRSGAAVGAESDLPDAAGSAPEASPAADPAPGHDDRPEAAHGDPVNPPAVSEADRLGAELLVLEDEHARLAESVAKARAAADAKEAEIVAVRDRLASLTRRSEGEEMQAWLAAQNRLRGDRSGSTIRSIPPEHAAESPIDRALRLRPRQVPGSDARPRPASETR